MKALISPPGRPKANFTPRSASDFAIMSAWVGNSVPLSNVAITALCELFAAIASGGCPRVWYSFLSNHYNQEACAGYPEF